MKRESDIVHMFHVSHCSQYVWFNFVCSSGLLCAWYTSHVVCILYGMRRIIWYAVGSRVSSRNFHKFHLGEEAHGSRGRKAMARGG